MLVEARGWYLVSAGFVEMGSSSAWSSLVPALYPHLFSTGVSGVPVSPSFSHTAEGPRSDLLAYIPGTFE